MRVQEIKDQIEALSAEDRFEIAAFLRQLSLRNDPDYGRRLDEICDRMKGGAIFTLEELEQRAAELDRRAS